MRFEGLFLNKDNFLFFAIKYYQNPMSNGLSDLKEDLNIFKNINKILSKFLLTKEIEERILLNQIIIAYNVWGDFATPALFYRIKKENWSSLKTVLVMIDRMPNFVWLDDKKIDITDIPLNPILIEKLRQL